MQRAVPDGSFLDWWDRKLTLTFLGDSISDLSVGGEKHRTQKNRAVTNSMIQTKFRCSAYPLCWTFTRIVVADQLRQYESWLRHIVGVLSCVSMQDVSPLP